MNPLNLVNGWKTEIGLAAFAILAIALKAEWVDKETFNMAATAIGVWTGIAFKHAIKKSGG